MTVENKRKSRSSMSPQSATQPKRRFSEAIMANMTAPGANPPSHPPPAYSESPPVLAPFLDMHPRPARWRKSHAQARQPVLQSIYKSPSPEPDPVQHSYGLRSRRQQQEQQKPQHGVELRFSFSHPGGEETSVLAGRMRRNVFQELHEQEARARLDNIPEVVNQSFSNLSFEQENSTRANTPRARSITPTNISRLPVPSASKAKATEAWARQTATTHQVRSRSTTPQAKSPPASRMPTISEIRKPKREGYGFSFSDSLFYDSDEYPDTECDFSPNRGSGNTLAPNQTFSTVQDDLVVVRDVGSFHLARPQRRLPCTTATREDTMRLKISAKSLSKFEESQDIYSDLVHRLQRMAHKSIQKNGGETSGLATSCAVQLKDFLMSVAKERVETGEVKAFVDHEIEWAMWLVEASRTGVMHLKGADCQCRSDWEE